MKTKTLGLIILIFSLLFNEWTCSYLFSADHHIDNKIILYIIRFSQLMGVTIATIILNIKKSIKRKSLSYFLIIFELYLLSLELFIRFYYWHKNDSSQTTLLGWSEPAQKRISGRINYSTYKYGFRMFGSILSNKKKVLIIGDSFTQAKNIDDKKTYYALLQSNRPDLELFVYGRDAYSTLQEYLILNTYFDEIDPDIIIIQSSFNDIADNDYILDNKLSLKRTFLQRPFLEQGKIILKEQKYPSILLNYSYLLRLVSFRLPMIVFAPPASIPPSKQEISRAIKTTNDIISLIKNRVKGTPLYFLHATNDCPSQTKWKEFTPQLYHQIFSNHNIEVIDGFDLQSTDDVNKCPNNFHWNAKGHKIIAQAINRFLVDHLP